MFNWCRRAIVVLVLVAAGPALADPAPVPVRFGSVGGITDAGLYLADEFGYFKAAGLQVTMRRMPSAPALMTAIATDQLDVAGISVTPGLFAAVAQGIPLRIVGDKQSHRPGFSATRLVVRSELAKNGDDAAIKALKGKTIAVSAKASSPYMELIDALREQGLTADDVKVVELPYPSMVAALTNGAVDGAVILEPFLSKAVQLGVGKDVSELLDPTLASHGESQISVPLVYSANFAGDRAHAQGFMTAYLKGVRIYNDAFVKGKDKDKIIEIIARHAGVDPAIVRHGYPAGLDPNQRVSLAALEKCQSFFVAQHFLQAPVPLEKLVDPSFAKAAVAELGDYH